MGAGLVKKVCSAWGMRLSNNAFRVLTVMAVTALDEPNEDNPAGLYRKGHAPLEQALQDADTKSADALKKAVQRAVEELIAVGAIQRAGRHGFVGQFKYQLTLNAEPGTFKRDMSTLTDWLLVKDTTRPPATGHVVSPGKGHDVSSTYETRRVPQVEDTSCPPATGHVVSPPIKEPVEEPVEEPKNTGDALFDAAPGTGRKPKASKKTKPAGHWSEDPDFVAWYEAYVKKGDPADAYKAWLNAKRKPLFPGVQELIRITKEFTAAFLASGTDLRFAKAPATWLNKECWHNSPPEPHTSPNGNRLTGADTRSGEIDWNDPRILEM